MLMNIKASLKIEKVLHCRMKTLELENRNQVEKEFADPELSLSNQEKDVEQDSWPPRSILSTSLDPFSSRISSLSSTPPRKVTGGQQNLNLKIWSDIPR